MAPRPSIVARDAELWASVDALVDRARSVDDLRTHRLHLLAAGRLRAAGRPLPSELALDERRSAVAAVTAASLLKRVRAAYDGALLVLKGPEVAEHYPDPTFRPYADLDLLVPDARAAQRALLAAGFAPVGDPRLYDGIHHERPLALPGLALAVELHAAPKWPDGSAPPPSEELFAAAVPSKLGIAGVETLHPAHHAVVLAAHSWAHRPLRRVGELVDIAVLASGVDLDDTRAVACRWGLAKVWDTSIAASAALLGRGRSSWPLRTWARHLPAVRDRTVLESHLERCMSAFWASPTVDAFGQVRGNIAETLLPAEGETPAAKLTRMRIAIRNAFVAESRHAEQLEIAGLRAPLFYELDGRATRPADEERGADPCGRA